SPPGPSAEVAGLAAAALLAFSPVAVDLATQARGYSGVAASAALCALAIGLISERKQRRSWALYAVGAVILYYLHSVGIYLIAGFGVATLAWALRDRSQLPSWAVTQLAVGAALLPGLAFLRAQLRILTPDTNGRLAWGMPPDLGEAGGQLAAVLTGLNVGVLGREVWPAIAAAAAIGLLLLAARRLRRPARILLAAAAVSFVLALAAAQRTAAFLSRYNVGITTVVAIGVGAAVGSILQDGSRLKPCAALAMFACLIVVQLHSLWRYTQTLRSD